MKCFKMVRPRVLLKARFYFYILSLFVFVSNSSDFRADDLTPSQRRIVEWVKELSEFDILLPKSDQKILQTEQIIIKCKGEDKIPDEIRELKNLESISLSN